MMTFRRLFPICALAIVGVALLAGCKGGNAKAPLADGGDTLRFKYATLLTVVKYPGRTHVEIKNPWKQGTTLHEYDFERPLSRMVVSTTAHCQLIDWLGKVESVKGVCDAQYIHVPSIADGLRKATIADCGNALAPDIERIIDLKTDAILLSPFENSGGYGRIEQLGVTIVETADYMEVSPLARAEWIRLYGILLGCEQKADSLFRVVESNYLALRGKISKSQKGRSILTERKTGSVWYCPGGRSTIGQLIKDANGGYAFSDDTHSGSLSLPFEQVLDKAGDADVWAFLTYDTTGMDEKRLLAEYNGYKELKAMTTGEVYECNTLSTRYFEEVPFRPDFILREFIQLLHPAIDMGGLKYYHRIE